MVADTGPINLVLIGSIDVLPIIFESVILPSAVQAELMHPDAPPSVQNWISNPPTWLDICEAPRGEFDDGSLEGLDEGEIAAIALATSLPADLLLMDDHSWTITGA